MFPGEREKNMPTKANKTVTERARRKQQRREEEGGDFKKGIDKKEAREKDGLDDNTEGKGARGACVAFATPRSSFYLNLSVLKKQQPQKKKGGDVYRQWFCSAFVSLHCLTHTEFLPSEDSSFFGTRLRRTQPFAASQPRAHSHTNTRRRKQTPIRNNFGSYRDFLAGITLSAEENISLVPS